MAVKKNSTQVDQENLLNFSWSLDCLIESQATIFNFGLLKLLEQCFGYSRSAIIFRGKDENEIVKPITHNLNDDLNNFYKHYQKIDPFHRVFISDSRLIAGQRCVIRASDVIDEATLFSYRTLFNSLAGIYHVAIMSFSVSVIIAIYKSEAEGNFSDHELMVLDRISQIVDSRSRAFKSQTAAIFKAEEATYINANRAKDHYLDNLDMAIIILDQNYHSMYQNVAITEYMEKVCPDRSVEEYFKSLWEKGKYITGSNGGRLVKNVREGACNVTIELLPCISDKSYSAYLYFITVQTRELQKEYDLPKRTALVRKETFKTQYGLSDREMEIISALSEGKTYMRIAESLYISINTVRSHVKNIYRKLDISNQRALLSFYNKPDEKRAKTNLKAPQAQRYVR